MDPTPDKIMSGEKGITKVNFKLLTPQQEEQLPQF